MAKKDKNWSAKKDIDHAGITNLERAERAEEYLDNYMAGRDGDYTPASEEARSYCADLIADLLHLSASKGWGAESVLQLAEIHFQSER